MLPEINKARAQKRLSSSVFLRARIFSGPTLDTLSPALLQHRNAMERASRSFAKSILALSLSLVGCGAPVKEAGHSLNAPGDSTKATGNTRVPPENNAPPSSTSKTGAPSTITPPPPPEQKPLYAEVPEGGRLIGDAGPIALEDWGKGGHWVAHCSLPKWTKVGARGEAKSAPSLHLTLGDKSESIDALLASDEAGRYLVALILGKAWLIDAVLWRRLDLTPLSPDLRFDSFSDHRSFAFTQNGLALLTGTEGKTGYFLPLSDKTDFETSVISWARPIEFGAHPVWRLSGHGLSFSGVTVPEGNAKKTWPAPPSSKPIHRCKSPSAPYHSFERTSAYRPDPSLSHVFGLAPAPDQKTHALEAAPAPGFVFGFRDGWVRREDSGRLLLVRGKTQEQIASESCGARILHADEKSGLFLIACEEFTPRVFKASTAAVKKKPKFRFDLYLIRPGFVRSLKVDTARTGVDFHGPTEQRLIPIRPGATAALVDFKTRALIPLAGELQVVLSSATQAVLRRGNELSLWTTKGEENIDLKLETQDALLTTPGAASVGKTLLSLGTALSTWELPGAPLAITEQGYALVPKQAPQLGQWPTGPLLLLGPPGHEAGRAQSTESQPSESQQSAP